MILFFVNLMSDYFKIVISGLKYAFDMEFPGTFHRDFLFAHGKKHFIPKDALLFFNLTPITS